MRVPNIFRLAPGGATLAGGLGFGLVLTLGLALAATALAHAPATAQEVGIEQGAVPPPAALQTMDGEAVQLAEVIGGRPALIEFWASYCHICLALHPRVVAAHEAYGDEVAFVMVAVAVGQDRDRVRQHVARMPMPGHLLWDARGEAVRAFDAPGTGFIVMLDAEGRVAYTGTGANQDLESALARITRRD
jgi:thiol-disulfide isomerase/thioredoxin